jgi:hypothetical protein
MDAVVIDEYLEEVIFVHDFLVRLFVGRSKIATLAFPAGW